MFKKKALLILSAVSLLVFGRIEYLAAETWQIEKGQDWKAVSAEGQDSYLAAAAQVKQLASMGRTKEFLKAVKKLKKDFPDIAGPDMDAFIKAETFFSKGKFTKAVRSYDKFMTEFPESKLYDAAMEREFSIATAYLAGRKRRILGIFKIKGYAEGIRVMERIGERSGNSALGLRAALAIVENYEKRAKFDEAYYKWSEIQSIWPTGNTGRNSLLGMARSKHAGYRGPNYDSSDLASARSYYENFEARYPKEAKKLSIGPRLWQINDQHHHGKDYDRNYQPTERPSFIAR